MGLRGNTYAFDYKIHDNGDLFLLIIFMSRVWQNAWPISRAHNCY